jgi:hypothetical protein
MLWTRENNDKGGGRRHTPRIVEDSSRINTPVNSLDGKEVKTTHSRDSAAMRVESNLILAPARLDSYACGTVSTVPSPNPCHPHPTRPHAAAAAPRFQSQSWSRSPGPSPSPALGTHATGDWPPGTADAAPRHAPAPRGPLVHIPGSRRRTRGRLASRSRGRTPYDCLRPSRVVTARALSRRLRAGSSRF